MRDDWQSAELSRRERALCTYAVKLTRDPASMREDDLTPLRQAGLDDRAVLDLVQVVSYFNYINRVADALGVPPEPEWADDELGVSPPLEVGGDNP